MKLLNLLIESTADQPEADPHMPAETNQLETNQLETHQFETDQANTDQPNTELFRAFEFLSDAIVITDTDLNQPGPNIIYVNPAFERMTGYARKDVIGRNPRFLQGPRTNLATLETMREALAAGRSASVQVENHTSDGQAYWIEMNIEPVYDQYGQLQQFIAVQRDITERKRLEEELRYKANHDVLTRIPNRAQFLERLDQSLAEAARYGHRVGVAMMDLDRFKLINDTLGHATGDLVLQEVAERLTRFTRETDVVGRLGGDEFAFLLIEPHDGKELLKTMRRVAIAVSKPMKLPEGPGLTEQRELEVTTSIGISVYPNDAADARTLLHHADLAMYAAKANGRNNVQVFTSTLRSEAAAKSNLERRLRHAIKHAAFELHFQPIHDAVNGQLVSLEALARWNDSKLGQITPETFIPLAEQLGLIHELGSWVIWQACHQGAWFQAERPITISVNVSPLQFNQSDLVSQVTRALSASGLKANALRLEITEQAMLIDQATCCEHLLALRALGVQVAIDDFGNGYSNFGQLVALPMDAVKIDRHFIQGIDTKPRMQALVEGIVQLAHRLGYRVIGEGVETQAEHQTLVELGCDFVQGFLLAKPMPAVDAANYVSSQRAYLN
jgi:diguanylate cyclase (GGDEF)-like protein/PAS domain S-box-containing protein